MGDSWVRDGAWEPLEGNGVSCGGGRREENTIATVVVRGRADIISGEAVSGKRAALAGTFVHENFSSRNCEGCAV